MIEVPAKAKEKNKDYVFRAGNWPITFSIDIPKRKMGEDGKYFIKVVKWGLMFRDLSQLDDMPFIAKALEERSPKTEANPRARSFHLMRKGFLKGEKSRNFILGLRDDNPQAGSIPSEELERRARILDKIAASDFTMHEHMCLDDPVVLTHDIDWSKWAELNHVVTVNGKQLKGTS